MTEPGFAHAGALLGVALDDPANHLLLSAVHVALHAEVLLRRDRDYVVRDGRIEIVDEWTEGSPRTGDGPTAFNRRSRPRKLLSVRAEGRVLGAIPMQHFVRLYSRLSGMTATAEAAAAEFAAFFGLETTVFLRIGRAAASTSRIWCSSPASAKHAAIVSEVSRASIARADRFSSARPPSANPRSSARRWQPARSRVRF